MKLATLVSFLRPSVAMLVLLPLFLIGLAEQAAANPFSRSLSQPLQNRDTYRTVDEVSRQAQMGHTPDDTSIRLMPKVKTQEDHLKICCLHANILSFYLTEILPHHNSNSANMHRLRVDLSRVSEDLQAQGCNVTHYHSHHHAESFRTKLASMERERGINKAVGEIDILFSHLQEYCVQPTNASTVF